MNELHHQPGVQFRQGKTWARDRKFQDKGYPHTDLIEVGCRRDHKLVPSLKWTQKGHIFIYQLLKENDILPEIELVS